MKILHIDDTFHPNFGYQCTPLAKFQQRAGNEVFVIAPDKGHIYPVYHSFGEYGETLDEDDARYESETGVKIIRVNGKGFVMGRLLFDRRELIKAIDEIKPDAILIHCVETLTAMYLMKRLRKHYPLVFDSHMLAMATKNKLAKVFEIVYKVLYTSTIKKEKYTVIKTQNDDYIHDYLGIPREQSPFISFGTDVLLFCPDENKKKEFLVQNGLPNNTFVVVSTGKLNKSKGGMLFAEAVKEKFQGERPVAVVVVADLSGPYESQVKKVLDESGNQVFYYPVQKYTDLPFFYQIADVTVFPKQCSMSFYDAQSCGSPVVSEKGHVNEDRNSHGNGLCFECGNAEDLRLKIAQIKDMPTEMYMEMRENGYKFVVENYSYETIAAQYTSVLADAINKFSYKTK